MPFVFEEEKSVSPSGKFVFEEDVIKEDQVPSEPFSFAGAGRAYASSVYGGAGGAIPDVVDLASEIPEPIKKLPGMMGIDQVKKLNDILGVKGTEELTKEFDKMLGGTGPQNASERILQQAGEFGGMEALFGTALGGPQGAGLGLAHGSVTGTLYGALKELGMDDTGALVTSGILTLSPVALRKLAPKIARQYKKSVGKLSEIVSDFKKGSPSGPLTPPEIPPAIELKNQSVGTSIAPTDRGHIEKSKKILDSLIKESESSKPLIPSQPIGTSAKELSGSATAEGADIGLRPTPQRKSSEYSSIKDSLLDKFSDSVLDNISTEQVPDEYRGGRVVKNEVLALNNDVYRGVNEQYSHSRQLNKGIEGIHAELAHDLLDRIIEMKKIPARGTVSNQIISKSEDLFNRLVTLDPKGNITGYQSISNQELIDQVQELRQIIDYDFLEGKPKNKFRPLINDIQMSIEQTAVDQGSEAAVEAWREATKSYRTWSDYFDTPEINPYRKRSNTQYEALYNKALNRDNFRSLKPILDLSEDGQLLSKAIQRDIAQRELSPFLENPRNINKRKFDKSLIRLESVISPEIISEVRKTFQEYSGKFPDQIRQLNFPESFSKADRAVAKIKNLSPEEVFKKMDSVSGIEELRDSLSKNPTQRKLFEDLKKEKILDMFQGGEVEKTVTGADLYKVVNKTKNYEILSELLGKEEVEALRLAAKEIGENEASRANLISIGKKIGKNFLKYKALKLLFILV